MPKVYIPIDIQRQVIQRANGLCEYCLLPASFSPAPFNFEHIKPVILGGLTLIDNLAYSCGGCNAYKSDKQEAIDFLTRQYYPLFNPRIDSSTEHFQWSEDDLLMVGKTALGRATIHLLKINRINNVNLRKLLKMAGLHPPN